MSEHYDVIIVGAGPVGDTLALLLAGHGIKTLIADKSPDIYPLPRAAHIDAETVRVFQQLGVAEAVMAASRPTDQYDFVTADGRMLLQFRPSLHSPYGWPSANMIHQPSIETILRKRMAEFSAITLRTGWEMTEFSDDGDGVIVTFLSAEGQQVARGRYLIGCDGASSRIRGALGVPIEDLKFDEPWLVVDTIVHDASRLPTRNIQLCDPERPTSCVMMGSGRHRWEFMLKAHEGPDVALEREFVQALLKPWNVDGAATIERTAVYRFHALISDEWKVGRVFLAGDAAHQTPPFAGQGLCSGVRDAANLGWKLAAVLAGTAGEALLDTYRSERRPNLRFYIDLALMMGRTVCIMDPVAAAARDEAMLAQRAAMDATGPTEGLMAPPMQIGCVMNDTEGAGQLFVQPCDGETRFDDVAGDGGWLISRTGVPALEPEKLQGVRTMSLNDAAVVPFAGALAAWLDRHTAEAVLVRPDRYVFGTGTPELLAARWAAHMQSPCAGPNDQDAGLEATGQPIPIQTQA